MLQKRNGWGYEGGVMQDNLLTVNSTYNNPALSCGGLYFNDLDVLLNRTYNFCFDWPGVCPQYAPYHASVSGETDWVIRGVADGCLDNNPQRLKKSYGYCYPFQDVRLNGYVQQSNGDLRVRARVMNGKLTMEYRAINGMLDWWVMIQLDGVTLSDTP